VKSTIGISLDWESVIIPEIWPELGCKLRIPELTLTTRDIPDFEKLMKIRIKALNRRKITLGQLQEISSTIEPFDGAKALIEDIVQQFDVIIISDSFIELSKPIIAKLGIEKFFANKLVVDDQDFILKPVLKIDGAKEKIIKREFPDKQKIIAVGDSFNDISMLKYADIQILFNPTYEIRNMFPKARVFRNLRDLRFFFIHIPITKIHAPEDSDLVATWASNFLQLS
jgi:phosphoserine/homoserine phosphotransferase